MRGSSVFGPFDPETRRGRPSCLRSAIMVAVGGAAGRCSSVSWQEGTVAGSWGWRPLCLLWSQAGNAAHSPCRRRGAATLARNPARHRGTRERRVPRGECCWRRGWLLSWVGGDPAGAWRDRGLLRGARVPRSPSRFSCCSRWPALMASGLFPWAPGGAFPGLWGPPRRCVPRGNRGGNPLSVGFLPAGAGIRGRRWALPPVLAPRGGWLRSASWWAFGAAGPSGRGAGHAPGISRRGHPWARGVSP